MLLAGVLLKMGGYALIRFNVQILPDTHLILAPALIIIGIVNIIYGALNAFAQDNVKRRIACSSVVIWVLFLLELEQLMHLESVERCSK